MSVATARSAPSRRPAPEETQRSDRFRLIVPQRGERRRRAAGFLAVTLIVVSLLAVVVGHTLLAEGQIKLGKIEASLTAEQARNSATVLRVAALETPSRIQSEANSMQLVQPAQVLQLPTVSLATPLAPLKLAPAGVPRGAG